MATRWGICSTGLIANDFCSALKSLPSSEHEVVAVAGRHKDSADQFAQKFAIPAAYGSYLDLAKDPTVAGRAIALPHPDDSGWQQGAGVPPAPLPYTYNFVNSQGFVYESCCVRQCLLDGLLECPRMPHEDSINIMTILKEGQRQLGLEEPFHCPTRMTVAVNKVQEFPMPPSLYTYNFVNSQGFVYEARCVRQCLLYGLLECPRMPHKDSINIMTILKEGQRQMGLEEPFHCPTQMTVAGNKVQEFPLPPSPYTYNFVNSQGFVYEACCVRQCLLDGLLECPRMPHKDSINIMTILEEGQRQLGVTF